MLSASRWTVRSGLLLLALPLVSLAQFQTASPPEYAAKVIKLTGAVSILKDNQPWALSVGSVVPAQQVIVSGPDGHAVFQVSDGSTFEVFPNSHVVFRKNPGSWRDLIDLLVGRIKVHIQKMGTQPNPNKIYTPTAVISVRGTTFDVSVNENDESTMVVVEEGEVAIQHALLPSGKPTILRDGESLTVYKSQPIANRLIDKGKMAQHLLRALVDAVYTATSNRSRTPGSTGPGGTPPISSPGGTVGDTAPPPPPPPPPPAPPRP